MDRFIGFEDLGSKIGRTNKVADEGLVAMLRGVSTNWKQAIAYYYVNHSVKQDRFLAIVNECLSAAHKACVEVISLVCDQVTSLHATNLLSF